MISNTRKYSSKSKGAKSSDVSGKNCNSKSKPMSPIARLMATFYGIEQK